MLDSLELELPQVVGCGLVWVQGTEPGSSGSAPRAHNFRGTSPVSSLLVTVVSLRRKAELKGPRMCSGSVLEHSTREAACVFCDAAHPREAQHFNSGQPESRPVQTFPFIPSGPQLRNGTSHNIREEPFLLS